MQEVADLRGQQGEQGEQIEESMQSLGGGKVNGMRFWALQQALSSMFYTSARRAAQPSPIRVTFCPVRLPPGNFIFFDAARCPWPSPAPASGNLGTALLKLWQTSDDCLCLPKPRAAPSSNALLEHFQRPEMLCFKPADPTGASSRPPGVSISPRHPVNRPRQRPERCLEYHLCLASLFHAL